MTTISVDYQYRSNAPCAFCSSNPPEHKITHTTSAGATLNDLPCCDECKQKNQSQLLKNALMIPAIVAVILFVILWITVNFGTGLFSGVIILGFLAFFMFARIKRQRDEAIQQWYNTYGT